MVTIARPPCDEGVIRSRPCAAAVPAQRGRWILAATILGSSLDRRNAFLMRLNRERQAR